MLLTIDPGNANGWATFAPSGELFACGLTDTPGGIGLARWRLVVIERPMIYPGGRTPKPDSIISVALKAGEWAGWSRTATDEQRYVKPREWKGTIDPDVCCRRVWAKLTDAERKIASAFEPEPQGEVKGGKDHVLDAIGIGLFSLGRWRIV